MKDLGLTEIKSTACELTEFCRNCRVPFTEDIEALCDELEGMAASDLFHVIVLGTFSRGKSTFLNALIGQRLLYSDPNEATGAITFVRNSPRNEITVQTKSSSFCFPIDENSYDNIEKYVGINKNPECSTTQVLVDCPMNGFDDDITFMDTPGLNGLGREQLELSKKAMGKADAVIMIVSCNSLDNAELTLLSGKSDFGKIRPQNLILVMNKVGRLLENIPPEREEDKIAAIRTEIRNQLKLNGVDELYKDIKIYAVDSLYYLQAVDDATYTKYKHDENSLSREEMRRISRFDTFRAELTEFLESSNRAEQMRSKISEVIIELCSEVEEYIGELKKRGKKTNEQLRAEFSEKLDKTAVLQRRTLTLISGYVRERINSLNDRIEEYKDERLNLIKKNGSQMVYESFNSLEDFNKGKYDWLSEQMSALTRDFSDTLCDKIKKFYAVFLDELSIHTEQKFEHEFGFSLNAHKYRVDTVTVKNASISGEFFSQNSDKAVKELEEKRRELKIIVGKIDVLNKKVIAERSNLESEEIMIESNYRSEMNRLGSRPTPKVLKIPYEVPVRVFLFFKKKETRYETKLDYSEVKAYDERARRVSDRRDADKEELKKKRQALVQTENELDDLKRSRQWLEGDVDELNDSIKREEQRRREKALREKIKVLDRSKSELTSNLHAAVEKSVNIIFNSAIAENERIRRMLTEFADKYVDEGTRRFREESIKKMSELNYVSFEDYDTIIKRLCGIREKTAEQE